MEEERKNVEYEEVLDAEIDDIWDILFPYMVEKKEKLRKLDDAELNKPRRHMRFLTM